MCDALLVCESTQLYELCKACSSAQNCAARLKYVQAVIAGSRRSVAKRRCHTGNAPRSSSVNQLCCLAASPRVAGRCRRERILLQVSRYAIRAEKSRGGAPAPYRSPRARRVEAGPPPPPPAWPARNLLFDTQRRRRKKMRLSDAFVKRVFQEQAPPLRCAAGCPIARFATQAYALIVLLSTHGRELLAQTAKTKVPSWNRQNYFIAPHSTRARLTRGGELGRNSVLKLHGGRPRQKKQP